MSSKRAYRNLADYAAQQGAPVEAFRQWGWQETTYRHRRALEYTTATGPRWRYIDGAEPRHDSPKGYKFSWYGLTEALALAGDNRPLVLVNGAAAVVVAQHYGVPAFAVSGGESSAIQAHLLDELLKAWAGEIILPADSDDTGRNSAARRIRQFIDAGYIARAVELQLERNGDFADFCKVHGRDSLHRLADLPEIAPAPPPEKPRLDYAVNGDDRRAEFVRDVVLPALQRSIAESKGKRFRCINPAHKDDHPSARIGNSRTGQPVYFCTCGAHNLAKTVAGWVGLDYRQWLKDTYPLERRTPRQRQGDSKPIRQRSVNTSQVASNVEGEAVRWVSDDLPPEKLRACKTLLIGAPVGMGKTRAIADYATWLPDETPLTGVAQFRLLTVALATALKAAHYEDAPPQYQHALGLLSRLVTSLSSLHKFPDRAPGIVVADEIEGDLQFILNSSTFEAGEAVAAYRAFKALVMGATQFIGMDAGLSDVTIDLIRRWRGEVAVNRYQRPSATRKVMFLRDKYAAIWEVGKLLRHRRGAVYVASSAEKNATDIADRYSAEGYRVLKISRDTSNTPKVQAFIKNAHERSQYDLVVYTSAMGAGVDISEPVYALVGVFDQKPLSPESAVQLFGRVRNARRYYAAVPPAREGYTTLTADELLGDRLKREYWTAQQTGVAPAAGGDYLEMLQLWAQYEARALKESAQWQTYFAARLKANGFTVNVNAARAPQAFIEQVKEWRAERIDSDWLFVEAAVGLAIDRETLKKMRDAGEEITRELNLRYERHTIEQALGHDEVTSKDRDLMGYKGKRCHFKLSDLCTDISDLKAADRSQANDGLPLQKRKYRTLHQRIVSELLKLAGITGATVEAQFVAFVKYFSIERSDAEVTERFATWGTESALSKFKAIGHQGNNARTVKGLCRWFLASHGLRLNSIRRGRADGRYMAYMLDSDTTAYRLARAQRTAFERAQRAALERTRNVQHIEGDFTFLVQPNPTRQSTLPPGEGWRPASKPKPRSASKTQPHIRQRVTNPFSRTPAGAV